MINFKKNALREFQNYFDSIPEYSFGELLYGALRLTGAKTLTEVRDLSDEDIFSAIEKAIQVETKENQ